MSAPRANQAGVTMTTKRRKATTLIPRTQHRDRTSQATADKKAAPQPGRWLPRWAVVLLVIALAAGATFALFEFVLFALFEFALLSKVPPELVGKWRVVGGQMDGVTFEFQRNGTMTGKHTVDGKEGLIEGKAEVTGTTLRTTTVNP